MQLLYSSTAKDVEVLVSKVQAERSEDMRELRQLLRVFCPVTTMPAFVKTMARDGSAERALFLFK